MHCLIEGSGAGRRFIPSEKDENAGASPTGAIKLPVRTPYALGVMERELMARKSLDDRNFALRSHAGDAGHLEVGSDSASVRIGQRIRREGREEMWDSLLVECKSQDDGTLTVEVVICHPDWDEPLRIASIQSNPADASAGEPMLRCDFQQKVL